MPAGDSCGSTQWLGSGRAGPLRMGQTERLREGCESRFQPFVCLEPDNDVARKLSRMHANNFGPSWPRPVNVLDDESHLFLARKAGASAS